MNVLDFASSAEAERNTASSLWSSKPDFTHAEFSRDGRVHTESRCNHCGFRIAATTSDGFDNEEKEHARACRGPEGE